jgi:hypothetical protein
MLAPAAKTKRLLERIQILLTFASFCAVVDATFIDAQPDDATGYYPAGQPQQGARGDTLFRDLARTERKRREAEIKDALEQR